MREIRSFRQSLENTSGGISKLEEPILIEGRGCENKPFSQEAVEIACNS